MKVFISWSGGETRDTAENMRDWLKSMFQRNVEVFVSSKDIEKGDRWAERLAAVLSDYNFGIVILNAENKDRPWVNFEAGALSKSVTKTRLIPFLCGLRPGDLIESPLGQFQNVEASKEGLMELAIVINSSLETPLAEADLKDTFDAWWLKRGERVCKYAEPATKGTKRPSDQVTLRDVIARIDRMESQMVDALLRTTLMDENRVIFDWEKFAGDDRARQTLRNIISHNRLTDKPVSITQLIPTCIANHA
jgi:hypothetical protein